MTDTKINNYQLIEKLGEGAYGLVYKAQKNSELYFSTPKYYAIKIMKNLDNEGVSQSILREISLICSLNHPSVMKIMDIGENVKSGLIYVVSEFFELDFSKFIRKMMPNTPQIQLKVKKLFYQLVQAVDYLHSNAVMHRDLKPSNILYTPSSQSLALCDFGLATQFHFPFKKYSLTVQTLWYRAPEVLLGNEEYSAAIDVWSLGCILAEMLTGKTLFKAYSQIEMLFKIFELLGTPNNQTWPGLEQLPFWKLEFPNFLGIGGIASRVPGAEPPAIGLLQAMLSLYPENRISARKILEHQYFQDLF